ncbi:MAG: NAD-dependent epimerase/dehydratase family protein [Candidatus Thermoplasmatota archaeon]|jgi:NADH dehydrogenase|nr:NAD-dependent epimerase/dehydratase family protein [Candidatus Thermoplasmatota archaeon]
MKALLIGGSGFIGSRLCESLDAEKISYFSRHRNEILASKNIDHIQGSVEETDRLKEIVKDYDTIFYLAGVFDEKEQKHEVVTLNGVKAVVDAIKKQDTGQKLIFFSAINTDYGVSEFFRIRRIAEDNVALAKDSLIIKLSNVFGDGDRITRDVEVLAKSGVRKMPLGRSLAPVSVNNLVTAVKAFTQYKGTIYMCSKEDISLDRAVNIVRSRLKLSPVKTVDNKKKNQKIIAKMTERVNLPAWRIADLVLNFYRENTSLYRAVKEPDKYEDYIKARYS